MGIVGRIAVVTATAAALAATAVAAIAQPQDICLQLERQLAQIESTSQVPADYRQYDRPILQQQNEINKAMAEARRAGCVGGFLFFQKRAEAKCAKLMPVIDEMRSNLQRLEQLRAQSGGDPRGAAVARSNILRQLAFNRCGASYGDVPQRGGLFSALFGQAQIRTFDESTYYGNGMAFGTYRTVCVRSCDGFYFPISFSTVPGRFEVDATTCQSMCPQAEAELYVYRNPGEDIAQAQSLSGQAYSALPNAFRYRTSFDKSCTCGTVKPLEFSTVTSPMDLGQPQPVSADQMPLPRLASAPGEDPETIANRSGSLVPGPVAPMPQSAATDGTTSVDLSTVRTVGPSYLYGR